ncbi:MAG TPA: vWA domain-containing protein [Bacteroidia bacterium]|jgi:hypothetical protein|nr:vWA domain-containing protein [Bacteroidia bacterium]
MAKHSYHPVFFLSLLFGLTFHVNGSSQTGNLVLNPDFESATSPAICAWPTENPPGTIVTRGWYTPTPATPDYYNSDLSYCDGFPIALAHGGQGRAAIICGMNVQLPGVHNYKEYLEGSLKSPLEAGKVYQVSFYTALDCSSIISGTGIGAYFSKEMIINSSKEKLEVTPQFISWKHITSSDGWTKLSGTFTATGGEQFITIGSFTDTTYLDVYKLGDKPKTFLSSRHISLHAYYYIDDVCVSLADENACKCADDKVDPPMKDYYLFLLDVSNSMNEKNKLKLMKKEMKHFVDSLGNGCQLGIMTFSDHTALPLPFCTTDNKENIYAAIDGLKGKGATNGDLALRKVALKIDSLQIHGRCHVIMATDGIFELSHFTKAMIDTCCIRNNASFCVLQLGDQKNADLEDIAQLVPESSYHLANKNNIATVLSEEIPDVTVAAPVTETVYYSEPSVLLNPSALKYYLISNPDDHFNDIPRR